MRNMNTYLSDVRDLVVPRLPTAELRIRAFMPVLKWAPYQGDYFDFINMLMGQPPSCTLGFTAAHGGVPKCILINSEGFHKADAYGETIAYTLIHELAHAATGMEHKDQEWVDACQVMGIVEHKYEGQVKIKPGTIMPDGHRIEYHDWHPSHEFWDMGLLQTIRALSTYPGDIDASPRSV